MARKLEDGAQFDPEPIRWGFDPWEAKMAQRALSAQKGRSRRPRGSLSQEAILDCAHRIVDEQGLSALSMPAVAARLGCGVTSLYWYYQSKDDLLRALTQEVVERIYTRLPAVGDAPWDEEITRYFTAFRSELLRDPLYMALFTERPGFAFSQPGVTSIISERLESEIATFMKLGLSAQDAAQVYLVCSIFTRGTVVFDYSQRVEEEAGHGPADQLRNAVARLDKDRFPVLTQVDFGRLLADSEDHFRVGLQLLVDGLRSSLETQAPARPVRKRTRTR